MTRQRKRVSCSELNYGIRRAALSTSSREGEAPDPGTPDTRRGTLRHEVIRLMTLQDITADAAFAALRLAPPPGFLDLAVEFEPEVDDILGGIQQVVDRYRLPAMEDVFTVEGTNIPERFKGLVRGRPGMVVPLTDEIDLVSQGTDLGYLRWEDDGRCVGVIRDYKGAPTDASKQLAGYLYQWWRAGAFEECTHVQLEAVGLMYPWRWRSPEILVDEIPTALISMIERARAIVTGRDLHEAGRPVPCEVNDSCHQCHVKDTCHLITNLITNLGAIQTLTPLHDYSIAEAPAEILCQAAVDLPRRLKAATAFVGDVVAEAERRIAEGEAPGWDLEKTPSRYGDKDSSVVRGVLVEYEIDPNADEFYTRKEKITAMEKAAMDRARSMGKEERDRVDALLKSARGTPTAYRKRIVQMNGSEP